MSRTLIFDPGGELGVRDPLNVTVEPISYKRSNKPPFTGRADFGRLVSGEESELVEIKFEAMVSDEDYAKLLGLHNHAAKQIDIGRIPEIVMYDLWEPWVELSAQTRAHVPGSDVTSSPDFSSYFLVRAGIFQMEVKTYSSCPVIEGTFTESFKVRYEDVYP
jgi:hypothetical protein